MSLTADDLRAWLGRFAAVVAERKDELTALDAAIGDADHGINMDRGMRAVLVKLDGNTDEPAQLLKGVGMTLISKVGGASGPLYGTLFMQAAGAMPATGEVAPEEWAAALDAAVAGIQKLGKAVQGEKTMLDALIPGRDAFRAALDADAPFGQALVRSAEAAHEGMLATIPIVATKGRASYLGERSAGHQDPGATSAHLLLRAAADTWNP